MEQPLTFNTRFYRIPENPYDTPSKHEEFSLWLAKRDESLHQFLRNVTSQLREHLDFSANSLEALGEWLLGQFENSKEALKPESSSIVDGASRYIGEVLIRHIEGSGWDIQLWHPKIEGYGQPTVYGPSYYPFRVSPRSLLATVITKRDNQFIKRTLENKLDNVPPIYRGRRRGYLINTPAEWEGWLQDAQPALAHFFSLLPTLAASKLDYSVASLDVLEAWILSQFPESILDILHQVPELSDGASRYVGETFIRNLDAKWDINLTSPLGAHFRWPIVKGLHQHRFKYCPMDMFIFRVTKDRKGNYLSKTLVKEVVKLKAGNKGAG